MASLSEVATISVEKAYELMTTYPDHCYLFDMRTEQEYDSCHPEHAIHYTPDNFMEVASDFNDNSIVMLICYRGNASKVEALQLAKMGLKELVFSVDGGVTAWSRAGLPLATS